MPEIENTKKPAGPDEIKDGDYLMEVTVHIAVRKKDAAAVMALKESWELDDTEQGKVVSAVLDVIDDALNEHSDIIEMESLGASVVPNLEKFREGNVVRAVLAKEKGNGEYLFPVTKQ